MLLYHFGYGPHGPARAGKRLRPQLVMRVAQNEGARVDDAFDAAAAVELLHNYSLVHDDIEDRDELRRGRRTLWNVYGIAQAINAGDALCAITFLTLLRAAERHPHGRVVRMTEILHEAHRVMCEGQSLDLQFETETHVDLERYTHMIACKTAALFEASCMLGAQAAGCDAEQTERYAQIGRAFGLAFQIQDDLLGIWADVERTGKVAQNDLARRKWTFPIVWALSGAPSPARAVVERAYAARRELDPATVSDVRDALDTLGARQAAVRAVEEHVAVVERLCPNDLRDYLLGSLAASVG
ncbi:MAG TPA: polyprenyl synthetase family protein [Candidatus Aquilonibacter sp.]|nr:polyprenyl synthetase family protein [Candidatus Aquilonibacter sp.]